MDVQLFQAEEIARKLGAEMLFAIMRRISISDDSKLYDILLVPPPHQEFNSLSDGWKEVEGGGGGGGGGVWHTLPLAQSLSSCSQTLLRQKCQHHPLRIRCGIGNLTLGAGRMSLSAVEQFPP